MLTALCRDEQRRFDEIEAKHLMGLLTREEALLARQEAFRAKKQETDNIKAFTANMMRRYGGFLEFSPHL